MDKTLIDKLTELEASLKELEQDLGEMFGINVWD